MMSKLAPEKGLTGNKYEGIKGISIKQEEMHAALVDKCPSSNRKGDTSAEVIVIVKWVKRMKQG